MTYASFTARLPSMTAVVAASLLAVAPMPSLADKATVCHDYAVTAAKLSQEAINLGCGFNPPVWSTDSSMHFKWCMHGNNSVSAPPQNVKRSADLQTCAAQKSAQTAPALAVCAIYAAEATALSVRAQKLGCGFSGPRWFPDYNAHFGWCMAGANPLVMVSETAARASDIAACEATKGK